MHRWSNNGSNLDYHMTRGALDQLTKYMAIKLGKRKNKNKLNFSHKINQRRK